MAFVKHAAFQFQQLRLEKMKEEQEKSEDVSLLRYFARSVIADLFVIQSGEEGTGRPEGSDRGWRRGAEEGRREERDCH